MKKLFFSLTALVLSAGAFAQAKADDLGKFKTESIDFGKIQQSNPATATFTVMNTGSKDLIIEQANPTCGCTISDFTKTPIKPGQTGEIKATYNAAGLGAFEKHLTVKFAGADDMKSITIKGEVLSADDYAKFKGGAAAPATATVATMAAPTQATVKPVAITPAAATTKTAVKTTAKTTAAKTTTKTTVVKKTVPAKTAAVKKTTTTKHVVKPSKTKTKTTTTTKPAVAS
jgi:hypothetical protein